MRNLVRASVLLLALVLSEPVLAGPLEDANAAYGKEDYATALRLFRQLADEQRAAIVMVTHDNKILDIADRVVNLEDGRLVASA